MFNGIYTIVYAFFDAAGRLDRESMRRQVQACVAMGAHGIGILGLTTEVSKLSDAERRQVIDWTVSDVAASGRRIPIACTIFGNSVNAQAELATYAQQAGVDWLILQPPRRRPGGQIVDEPYCFDFFLAVMEQCALPVAIQNAPEYLGVGLSNASLSRLMQRASNFNVLKGEGSATLIQQTIAALGDRIAVLNGRGGLELPDQIRAGVAGMIVDPSSADWQVKVWNAMLPHGRQTGAVPVEDQVAAADYAAILPAICFVMQSIDTLVVYGKRLFARRLGLRVVYDREPILPPTPFGLQCVERFASRLGALPS